MMQDMGLRSQVRVWTDSDAAKDIASRRELGRTNHIELNYLWRQEVTKSGRVRMRRVSGEHNLADHFTKGTWWAKLVRREGVLFLGGLGVCESCLELPRCPGYVVPGNA